MITALALSLSLMLADAPPAADTGEPLPPGAPTDSYQLSAWCYGALDEYLAIYDRVKPDLRDIDHMFGTSVVEDEPYHSDMAAARGRAEADWRRCHRGREGQSTADLRAGRSLDQARPGDLVCGRSQDDS
ncbi:MAG: hypothetical protein WDM85_02490 [Caulobacteraceae bacterium]